MILANGTICPDERREEIISRLPQELLDTLARPPLDPLLVVGACERLAGQFRAGAYRPLLAPLLREGILREEQLEAALSLLERESLLHKLSVELGSDFSHPADVTPTRGARFSRRWMPLGTLFHIAAGNAEALPAYSAVEGLLAGNINLLKLPSADDGLSVRILQELTRVEPALAPYLYVFDTPSSDLQTIGRLAGLADGIIVWGGDEAVRAVRRLAPPNARLIEWGHKLSFAYLTEAGAQDDGALASLAAHIFETNQLFCSSCQGIFLDTAEPDAVDAFCRRFLPILDRAGRDGARLDLGMQARITLWKLTQTLAGLPEGVRFYEGEYGSLTACADSLLEPSMQFGNCWVRPLPRERLVETLRPCKGTLQTAGLLCAAQERPVLTGLLCRAGLSRITQAGRMSRMVSGEAHDGEYPLRRYSRMVEIDHE